MELQITFILAAVMLFATTEARYASPQNRIYGGHEAAEGQFPYQVLVTQEIANVVEPSFQGTMLSPQPTVLMVPWLQLFRAATIEFNSGGVVGPVAEVKIHPQYAEYDYDIALLKLNTSLEFNDKIKPIPLASTAVPAGSQVIVTGWGGIESGGISDQLLYTTEEALNHETCIERLNVLADSMLCLAKDIGNGICGGDSGGPAVYNGVLIGVASFGVNGCGSSLPDGYAAILPARDWICASTDGAHSCSL